MIDFPRILKKRTGYIERIKPFIRKNVAKVLTGQRRVGKCFLLYQLIEEVLNEEPDANIIYINLEDFEFNTLQTAQDLHAYVTSQSKVKERNIILRISESGILLLVTGLQTEVKFWKIWYIIIYYTGDMR